jgi:hypothetical protein
MDKLKWSLSKTVLADAVELLGSDNECERIKFVINDDSELIADDTKQMCELAGVKPTELTKCSVSGISQWRDFKIAESGSKVDGFDCISGNAFNIFIWENSTDTFSAVLTVYGTDDNSVTGSKQYYFNGI